MKKKKLLSVLVAAALGCSLFSAVPIVSQAAEYEYTVEYTSGDWTYAFENYDTFHSVKYSLDNGCAITGYNGSDTNIIVPSTLDGNTVLHIEARAFYGNKNITSVTIPDTIESIEWQAFGDCTGITNVNLGNSVKGLDRCFDTDSLTSIVIPRSMTSADAYSLQPFYSPKTSLKTATIESGGMKIPRSLFSGCYSLENVNIPEGITEIENNAFNNCRELREIAIPVSVQSFGDCVFYGCSSLEKITIPDSVQSIGWGAFWDCDSLEKVTLPDSIQSIEDSTFSGCGSLKEITIPDSVQDIEEAAFMSCRSLKEVSLPDSVKSIAGGAFVDCTSLEDFYDYNKNTEYKKGSTDAIECVFESNTTLHGYQGSNAEKYAKKYNLNFVPLTEKDIAGRETQMRRLYNPNSGEHLYTSNAAEKNNLVSLGWKSEGPAWMAPASSKTPVYRVYNPNSGEHHYTIDTKERNGLVKLGWKDEGIGWYSDDSKGTPLYRLYNPNATGVYEAGSHHYTKDVNEKNSLIAAGWRDEGIGWYGK